MLLRGPQARVHSRALLCQWVSVLLLVTHAVGAHLPDEVPRAFQVGNLPKGETMISAGPSAVPTQQDPFQLSSFLSFKSF